MQTTKAALTSAAFFIAAPGTVVGLGPWLITHWDAQEMTSYWITAQLVGIALICAGLIPPVHAFARFVVAGGTPMPLAPTERLVVDGFNRYVRNPMYVGLLAVIIGQALLLGRISLLWYAAAFWLATASFVRWYEEPSLIRRFGADYEEYRRAVPAWLPRLHPWTGDPSRGANDTASRT